LAEDSPLSGFGRPPAVDPKALLDDADYGNN